MQEPNSKLFDSAFILYKVFEMNGLQFSQNASILTLHVVTHLVKKGFVRLIVTI